MMHFSLFLGFCFTFTSHLLVIADHQSDIGKTYHLYHLLGDGSSHPTPRGTISINAGCNEDESNTLCATYHPDASFKLNAPSFDLMVKNHQLYTLFVIEDEYKNEVISSSSSFDAFHPHLISASVPGCSLRRANLREEITLYINPTGKLMSVSYRPQISPLAPSTCENLKPLSEINAGVSDAGSTHVPGPMTFKTTAAFESPKSMMAIPTVLPQSRPPPGLKWYRRNSKNNPSSILGGDGKHEGGDVPFGEEGQPSGFKTSFLYRYWYIILPLAIAGLFGGVEEEQLQEGKGGQVRKGGQSGGGADAASPAQRQRRGKRD